MLGSSGFLETLRHSLASPRPRARPPLAPLIARVCRATGTTPVALAHGSRRAPVARAREGSAYLALDVCGYTGVALAGPLGVRPPAVYRAARRGRATHERWEALLGAGNGL